MVGILARTGTPVDRTVHISLQAMEAIHLDWVGGAPMPGCTIAAEEARKFDLAPKQVTAALVGLKNRAAVFAVQRCGQRLSRAKPLMAVLPGVALDELWERGRRRRDARCSRCRRWSRSSAWPGWSPSCWPA